MLLQTVVYMWYQLPEPSGQEWFQHTTPTKTCLVTLEAEDTSILNLRLTIEDYGCALSATRPNIEA